MHRYLLIITALGVIVAAGVLHGQKTDRWGIPRDLVAETGELKEIPQVIGGWTGEDVDVDDRQFVMAEAIGHISRQYTKSEGDDAAFNVMILGGRHGPIAVHPPTVCFTGAGFVLQHEPKAVKVRDGNQTHTFWVADFAKQDSGVSFRMRTYWGWNGGEGWTASANPRREFAGRPLLYKLYLTRILRPGEVEGKAEPSDEFLKTFLPAAAPHVFPAT